MFTREESWKMSEPEKVLALIKEIGIWRLGNFDGCICSSFKLRDVNVDISCGKGMDRAARVYSNSMDFMEDHDEQMKDIAEEIKRQAEQSDERGPIPVFFEEWKNPNKSARA
jgi:hypothetical protein